MTRQCARVLLASAMAVAMLAVSIASLGASSKFKYEGTWEGVLSRGSVPKDGKEIKWESTYQLRLAFSGGKVSVYQGRDGEWREIKPGKFKLETLDTNAVIFAIATGQDKDGVWVETQSFSVTVIDSTHLNVMWQRQVKNKDMEVSNPDAVWGVMAYGTLTRVGASGA